MEKTKRVLAIITVAFIILSCITTLISAFINTPFGRNLFHASLFCTVVVPIVLYGYMLVIKYTSKRGANTLEQASDEDSTSN